MYYMDTRCILNWLENEYSGSLVNTVQSDEFINMLKLLTEHSEYCPAVGSNYLKSLVSRYPTTLRALKSLNMVSK